MSKIAVSEPLVADAAFSSRGQTRTDKAGEREKIRERKRQNSTGGGVFETSKLAVSGTEWTEQEEGGGERARRNLTKGNFVKSETTVTSEAGVSTVSGREWTESPVVARRARDGRYEEEHDAFMCGNGDRGGGKRNLPGMPRPGWEDFRERECFAPMKVRGEGAV